MKLFYFTSSYPFGIGEQWKANELKELVHHFESVTVIPFSFGGNFDNPKPLPPKVLLQGPLFANEAIPFCKSDLLKVFVCRFSMDFLREFFRRRVYRKKMHIVSWALASLNAMRLIKHPVIKSVLRKADKNTVLYFYWGKGAAEFLPFVNTSRFYKTFVRLHRFDLFEYENRGYIPYRRSLLQSVDVAAPSSLAGKLHLDALYPECQSKIKLVRCGTIGNKKLARFSDDNVLRVISCSFLSPVKRVNLMIESLPFVEFPIIWCHIGNGKLMDQLQRLAIDLKVSDKFIFKGMMDSTAVLDFYTSYPVDLFVNTSSSEGVPFSIMEAFSVGIPVMATNVGGTGEIVDDGTGKLLAADVSPKELAGFLKEFYEKSIEGRNVFRREVYRRYRKYWDAEKLAKELAVMLIA